MRQIVLDTETTGLEPELNHRIIEIGCVELVNRRATGRTFHRYLNPERDIDEGAQAVHGLSREQLSKEPTFAQIHGEFLEFVQGAELVIHNALFDVAFLDAELGRLAVAAVPAALAALSKLDKEDHLFSRDIVAVDMRLSDRLTVQLSDDAAKAREELFKKSKKKAGDA